MGFLERFVMEFFVIIFMNIDYRGDKMVSDKNLTLIRRKFFFLSYLGIRFFILFLYVFYLKVIFLFFYGGWEVCVVN